MFCNFHSLFVDFEILTDTRKALNSFDTIWYKSFDRKMY